MIENFLVDVALSQSGLQDREILKGKGFHISYNGLTSEGAETALCKNEYLILLGDYREDFRPLVKKGYKACLAKFDELVKNGAKKSPWSN